MNGKRHRSSSFDDTDEENRLEKRLKPLEDLIIRQGENECRKKRCRKYYLQLIFTLLQYPSKEDGVSFVFPLARELLL